MVLRTMKVHVKSGGAGCDGNGRGLNTPGKNYMYIYVCTNVQITYLVMRAGPRSGGFASASA